MILKKTKPKLAFAEYENKAWERVVEEFAATFELDSPFFKREKFLTACGYKFLEEKVAEVLNG